MPAHRTPFWNGVTHYGTVLGATTTVIALTAAGCLVLALRRHGPRLPLFLALAVIGETLLFLLAAAVLDRVRPPIPHLDAAPPTSSFPSGHTAASVALWVGLALGLARTRPGHRLRFLSWALAVAVPLFVLLSRLYRGMHWPTDVAASVVFALSGCCCCAPSSSPHVPGRRTGRLRRDVDEDLADGAVLHGLVRRGGLGQRVDVQRQPGLLADPHRAVQDGGVDVLDARAPWPGAARCRRARTASGRWASSAAGPGWSRSSPPSSA